MSTKDGITIHLSAAFAAYFAEEDPATGFVETPDEIELARIYAEAERLADGSLVMSFPASELGWNALANLHYYTEGGVDSCNDGDDGDSHRAACETTLPLVEDALKKLTDLIPA